MHNRLVVAPVPAENPTNPATRIPIKATPLMTRPDPLLGTRARPNDIGTTDRRMAWPGILSPKSRNKTAAVDKSPQPASAANSHIRTEP